MPTGLDHPDAPEVGFRTEPDIAPGALWTSQSEDSTIMAASARPGAVPTTNATPPVNDISLGQRMIAATCGNILTGLLGESCSSRV